jgi:hypothetical protein
VLRPALGWFGNPTPSYCLWWDREGVCWTEWENSDCLVVTRRQNQPSVGEDVALKNMT